MTQTSKIVIKKYPNRRLYNTLTSIYIKLEDITLMVKKDIDFIVIDSNTKEDITRITLVQMILNHEAQGYELMPENLIKTMIKFYDHPLNKIMQDCFTKISQNFSYLDLSNIKVGVDTKPIDALNYAKEYEKMAQENFEYFSKLFFSGFNVPPKN